jgi:asparagine synthase (glutamine-hydrolysing)
MAVGGLRITANSTISRISAAIFTQPEFASAGEPTPRWCWRPLRCWGVEALNRFDGMFAFAVYDIETRTLLLARDPFGEKPLYFTALPGGGPAFASELHALELLPSVDLTVDVEAVGELLCFQYIGAPRSIYSSIKKLPPGHWLRVDADGRQRIERYFAFEPGSNGYTSWSKDDLVDELEDILVRSIRGRLIADVPLGAFLSGGVDSSTVCALVRSKLGQPLKTFSTGFAGASESEHLIARKFANLLGTDHQNNWSIRRPPNFYTKLETFSTNPTPTARACRFICSPSSPESTSP